MIILIKIIEKDVNQQETPTSKKISNGLDICIIVFSISFGISFLRFLFSAIYFCQIKKDDEKIYLDARNLEFTNIPQNPNI